MSGPLPLGEGGAQRRVREARPTILNKPIHRGAGCPHPALSRHLVCSLSMNKISVRQIVATKVLKTVEKREIAASKFFEDQPEQSLGLEARICKDGCSEQPWRSQ